MLAHVQMMSRWCDVAFTTPLNPVSNEDAFHFSTSVVTGIFSANIHHCYCKESFRAVTVYSEASARPGWRRNSGAFIVVVTTALREDDGRLGRKGEKLAKAKHKKVAARRSASS